LYNLKANGSNPGDSSPIGKEEVIDPAEITDLTTDIQEEMSSFYNLKNIQIHIEQGR